MSFSEPTDDHLEERIEHLEHQLEGLQQAVVEKMDGHVSANGMIRVSCL
ncbi:hypothetical protein [Haloarcula halophila]